MESPTYTAPLASEKIAIERKLFFIDLRENARGRYLKITEDTTGRRNTILLPADALPDFVAALSRIGEYEAQL